MNEYNTKNKSEEVKKLKSSIYSNIPVAKIMIPLLDSLNWQGDKGKLIEALATDDYKGNIDDLIESMANLNFKVYKSNKITPKNMENIALPLLLLQKNGYLVLINRDKENFLAFDCENEKYVHIACKKLKGKFYFFKYADNMDDSLIITQTNWFNKLIYRFKKSFAQLGILTLLITGLDLLLPLFVVLLYDKILYLNSLELLILTFAGILIYMISSYLLTNLRIKILNYISVRIGNIITSETFKRLMYLSPSYTETASISSQISRIKDFENIKNFFISGNFISLFDLIFSIVYICTIFLIAGLIGIIPITVLICLIAIGFIMRPFQKIKIEKVSDAASNKQQNLMEILKNIYDIKNSGNGIQWIEKTKGNISNYCLSNYESANYVTTSKNISYLITNTSVLFVIYFSVIQVFNGELTTGAMIGVLILYWKIMSSIRGVFNLIVQFNGFLKSVAQINRFMQLPQDNDLKTSMISANELKGYLKFTDVSIKYKTTAKPALLSVNFTSNPGELLGITGHDGSGKTTILKLILGMYQPQAGRISIDNKNIKQLEPLSLRKSIAYAPEKDMILTGTIRDNFKKYNPSITDEQILTLSEKTGLGYYYRLFNYSLDTNFTEQKLNEASLSFKKLFNLTRMLSRESNLYLVDEPENHLNQEQLNKFLEVLKECANKNKATIIIATKNAEVLEFCDNVIRLNQGRIVKKI